MSQPPANPYGPPQQGGWPPPQQGFGPAQPGQPYGYPYPVVGPPPKKSNVGTIVFVALAAVLVLCLGGGATDIVDRIRPAALNETSAVGAYYGDPVKKEFLVVAAVSGPLSDPRKELDAAVNRLSDKLNMTNMTAVEPGPLGGEARCGDGRGEGVPLAACFWADRGSMGVVVMYYRSAEQVAAEFVGMRGQIEQRS
ncbi:hypothetical protein ACFY2Q_14745 [Micromonospora sp. NPDC000316]|uniref:hypothetical protein n=1 Tax=Micromonospora sp. NPDC000316 TaxID=3364216 RepID=UPI0036783D5D